MLKFSFFSTSTNKRKGKSSLSRHGEDAAAAAAGNDGARTGTAGTTAQPDKMPPPPPYVIPGHPWRLSSHPFCSSGSNASGHAGDYGDASAVPATTSSIVWKQLHAQDDKLDEREIRATMVTAEQVEAEQRQIYGQAIEAQAQQRCEEARRLFLAILEVPLLRLKKTAVRNSVTILKYLTLKNLGAVYLELGRREDALRALTGACVLLPSYPCDPLFWPTIGKLAIESGRLALGRIALERGVSTDPDNWLCVDMLLDLLRGIGDTYAMNAVLRLALHKSSLYEKGALLCAHKFAASVNAGLAVEISTLEARCGCVSEELHVSHDVEKVACFLGMDRWNHTTITVALSLLATSGGTGVFDLLVFGNRLPLSSLALNLLLTILKSMHSSIHVPFFGHADLQRAIDGDVLARMRGMIDVWNVGGVVTSRYDAAVGVPRVNLSKAVAVKQQARGEDISSKGREISDGSTELYAMSFSSNAKPRSPLARQGLAFGGSFLVDRRLNDVILQRGLNWTVDREDYEQSLSWSGLAGALALWGIRTLSYNVPSVAVITTAATNTLSEINGIVSTLKDGSSPNLVLVENAASVAAAAAPPVRVADVGQQQKQQEDLRPYFAHDECPPCALDVYEFVCAGIGCAVTNGEDLNGSSLHHFDGWKKWWCEGDARPQTEIDLTEESSTASIVVTCPLESNAVYGMLNSSTNPMCFDRTPLLFDRTGSPSLKVDDDVYVLCAGEWKRGNVARILEATHVSSCSLLVQVQIAGRSDGSLSGDGLVELDMSKEAERVALTRVKSVSQWGLRHLLHVILQRTSMYVLCQASDCVSVYNGLPDFRGHAAGPLQWDFKQSRMSLRSHDVLLECGQLVDLGIIAMELGVLETSEFSWCSLMLAECFVSEFQQRSGEDGLSSRPLHSASADDSGCTLPDLLSKAEILLNAAVMYAGREGVGLAPLICELRVLYVWEALYRLRREKKLREAVVKRFLFVQSQMTRRVESECSDVAACSAWCVWLPHMHRQSGQVQRICVGCLDATDRTGVSRLLATVKQLEAVGDHSQVILVLKGVVSANVFVNGGGSGRDSSAFARASARDQHRLLKRLRIALEKVAKEEEQGSCNSEWNITSFFLICLSFSLTVKYLRASASCDGRPARHFANDLPRLVLSLDNLFSVIWSSPNPARVLMEWSSAYFPDDIAHGCVVMRRCLFGLLRGLAWCLYSAAGFFENVSVRVGWDSVPFLAFNFTRVAFLARGIAELEHREGCEEGERTNHTFASRCARLNLLRSGHQLLLAISRQHHEANDTNCACCFIDEGRAMLRFSLQRIVSMLEFTLQIYGWKESSEPQVMRVTCFESAADAGPHGVVMSGLWVRHAIFEAVQNVACLLDIFSDACPAHCRFAVHASSSPVSTSEPSCASAILKWCHVPGWPLRTFHQSACDEPLCLSLAARKLQDIAREHLSSDDEVWFNTVRLCSILSRYAAFREEATLKLKNRWFDDCESLDRMPSRVGSRVNYDTFTMQNSAEDAPPQVQDAVQAEGASSELAAAAMRPPAVLGDHEEDQPAEDVHFLMKGEIRLAFIRVYEVTRAFTDGIAVGDHRAPARRILNACESAHQAMAAMTTEHHRTADLLLPLQHSDAAAVAAVAVLNVNLEVFALSARNSSVTGLPQAPLAYRRHALLCRNYCFFVAPIWDDLIVDRMDVRMRSPSSTDFEDMRMRTVALVNSGLCVDPSCPALWFLLGLLYVHMYFMSATDTALWCDAHSLLFRLRAARRCLRVSELLLDQEQDSVGGDHRLKQLRSLLVRWISRISMYSASAVHQFDKIIGVDGEESANFFIVPRVGANVNRANDSFQWHINESFELSTASAYCEQLETLSRSRKNLNMLWRALLLRGKCIDRCSAASSREVRLKVMSESVIPLFARAHEINVKRCADEIALAESLFALHHARLVLAQAWSEKAAELLRLRSAGADVRQLEEGLGNLSRLFWSTPHDVNNDTYSKCISGAPSSDIMLDDDGVKERFHGMLLDCKSAMVDAYTTDALCYGAAIDLLGPLWSVMDGASERTVLAALTQLFSRLPSRSPFDFPFSTRKSYSSFQMCDLVSPTCCIADSMALYDLFLSRVSEHLSKLSCGTLFGSAFKSVPTPCAPPDDSEEEGGHGKLVPDWFKVMVWDRFLKYALRTLTQLRAAPILSWVKPRLLFSWTSRIFSVVLAVYVRSHKQEALVSAGILLHELNCRYRNNVNDSADGATSSAPPSEEGLALKHSISSFERAVPNELLEAAKNVMKSAAVGSGGGGDESFLSGRKRQRTE